jgi:hypothetical protein
MSLTSPSSGERRVLARGAIGVDPRAAIAKLREFMLPDPALYVAELVRVAVELGAQKIVVDNTARDFSLEFVCKDAAPAPAMLVRLFEQLFASEARALRLLAIATNTALGLQPTFVDIFTGAERKERSIARVRFVPLAEGGEPVIDGALDWVDAPEGFTERSLRVHVRERFGTSVVREWFAEPVESKVLRTRCLLVPASIVRAVDGKDLDRGDPPPALARVPLGEKLHGELALVRGSERELDVIDFYERGVLLSRESLFGGESPMNLRAYVDEAQLPTNVSRSAIDRSGSFGRQLSRALDDARSRLIQSAIEQLDGPHGAEIAAALRVLILRRLGGDWVAVASYPKASREDLFLQPALRAPLIPMVHQPPRSLVDLVSRKGSELLLFRGARLPPNELARWLTNAVHAVDESIVALIGPLDPGDAELALARAQDSHERYRKFLAHKPREPRVSGTRPSEVARVMIGASKREGFESVPSVVIGNDPKIEGELVIHGPRATQRAMELVVFVEGRPLPSTSEDEGALFVQAAVQHASLTARSDFTGPERSATLNTTIAQLALAANEVLWFVACFLADPKRYDGDGRVHWIAKGALELTEAERASLVERALNVQRQNRSAKAGRARLAELLAESPAVARVPLFQSTTGKRWSIAELKERSEQCDRTILFCDERASIDHPIAPVLMLTEMQRELLSTLFADRELVDYGRFATSSAAQGGCDLLAWDQIVGPWLSLRGASTSARIAVATRSAQLVATHRGQLVAQTTDYGPLGRCVLVLEDSTLIPKTNRAFSQASLSAEARAIVANAQFDLLHAMLRAIGGDRAAAMALDVALPWSPPLPVRAFIFVAAARLRAMAPDETRGTDEKVAHKDLLRLCEELPLVAVRTRDGVRELSLAELRERARQQGGALVSVENAPDDVDYDEKFEPVIVARGEYEAALAVGVGARLTSADTTIPARREARKLRLALESFERRPTTEFANLSEFRPIETVAANGEQFEAVMGLLPTPGRARYQVLFRDRVAASGEVTGTDLRECPVILRVRVNEAEKALAPTLDALTAAGQALLTVAMKRALRKLVEQVCTSADGTRDPGASARALVAAYCADAGRVDDKLRAKVGRAVLWHAVPTGLASAEQCAVHGRGRVLFVSKQFDRWIAAPDGETDPIAAYIEPTPEGPKELREIAQDARRRLLDTLEFTTTLAPKDATDEFERTQRARRLLRSAKENIVLRGAPAHPALACRIEEHDPKLGVGELRLTTAGAAKLRVHLFLHGSPLRVIEASAPVSLTVAIESSALSEEQAKSGPFPDSISQKLVAIARKMMTEAMRKHDELPPWSLAAQRWALLQGPSNVQSLRERRVFVDTMGEPMTLADIDQQQDKFGHVAYSTDPQGAPLEPLDEGRRVLRASAHEASWITGSRVPLDYTEALRDEQRAHERRRMPPARSIVVRQSVPATCPTLPLTVATHDYEGEVVLITARSAPTARVYLYQGRKPLGETETPSPWPALVAIEVAELRPNRSETAPVEDAVFHRARAKVSELVRAALDAHFVAPPSALAMVRTNSTGSPAIRGGSTRAVGALWLLPSPVVPGVIDVREPGESTVRPYQTRSTAQGSRARTLPVGGQLWFNWTGSNEVTIAQQVNEIVRWAYRSLLGQLVSAKKAETELVHAHLAYAAAACAIDTDTLKKWASDRTLPDTCTTYAKLQAHLAEGNVLELCAEGDARSAQERFVVQRSNALWFLALESLNLVQAPSSKPAERRTEPPPPPVANVTAPPPTVRSKPKAAREREPEKREKPKAKVKEPTVDDQVLCVLRSVGVAERDLRAVRLNPQADATSLVSYEASTAIAVVSTQHPLAAALLTERDVARAHRVLAMAVLGEMNRAIQRFTDADEMRVLQAMLELVAEK